MPQEIEIKFRLEGKSEYEKFCQGMGPPEKERDQVNHYFQSTDGLIPGDKGVIRIRVEDGKPVLTVKLGGELIGGVAVSQEFEEPWPTPVDDWVSLSDKLWEVGHAGMQALEKAVGKRFLLVWAGQMSNNRKFYPISEDLCLEVDASCYSNGKKDYEIEVETEKPEEVRELLKAFLDTRGVRYSLQTETKYQRFLKYSL